VPENVKEVVQTAGLLGGMGVMVGIGQLLASREQLTWRIVIGRALSSLGLGASSAAILVWLPDLHFAAQLGLAALIASLGTSGLERLVQRIFGVQR